MNDRGPTHARWFRWLKGLILLALILVSGSACLDWYAHRTWDRRGLADKLGVKDESYIEERRFPSSYFYQTLKPGMPMEEVHDAIKYYEKVLRCERDHVVGTEIYYYYTTGDTTALRFMVGYDEDGRFVRLMGEDDNERTILTDRCEPGRIGE